MYREMNHQETISQIGTVNVLAISGGRVRLTEDLGLSLPVSSGYSVEVRLTLADLYEIRRVFKHGDKVWIKGTVDGVYADQLGEMAYQASCYKNVEFGS